MSLTFIPRFSLLICLLLATTSARMSAQLTTIMNVVVSPLATILITTGTTALIAPSNSAPYTGITSFTYVVRTSQSTGSGSIQLKITSDFSPSSGPSVASPPTSGDALTYTCTATVGTPCSTTQTASTTSNTSVVSFGADTSSSILGSSGSVTWSLSNDPVYKSGTYTATATFTISAT